MDAPMPWIVLPVVAVLGLVIGYTVGNMPCWKSWQGYVGLMIVLPVVITAGVGAVEAVADCVALGCGFALARRPTH